MRCPYPGCGSLIHDVKATRKKGSVVVRTRECYNHHRFQTEERVVGAHGKREKVRVKVLSLLKESRKYPVRHPKRKTVLQIAAEVGVSSDTVFRIARGEIAIRQLRRKSSSTSL